MIKHYKLNQCVCCECIIITRGKSYQRFDTNNGTRIMPLMTVWMAIINSDGKMHAEFNKNKEFKDKEYLCNEPKCQKMKILL